MHNLKKFIVYIFIAYFFAIFVQVAQAQDDFEKAVSILLESDFAGSYKSNFDSYSATELNEVLTNCYHENKFAGFWL